MYILRIRNFLNDLTKSANSKVLIFIFTAALTLALLRPAYTVYIGDTPVATVASETEFETLFNLANNNIKSILGESNTITDTPKFLFKIIPVGGYSSEDEIMQNLMSIPGNISCACAVNIDGEIIAYAKDKSSAEAAVSKTVNSYSGENKRILNEISYKNEYIATFNIYGNESLYESIKGKLTVESQETCDFTEDIPYEVVEKENPQMKKGETAVIQEGSYGKNNISMLNTLINGVKTYSKIISENVVAASVPEIREVGTKPVVGSGVLSRPLSVGSVSSRFGSRDGRRSTHKGIDIACATDTPIEAADNGIVITAEYRSDYGNLIVIDHQNGYVTYYAHLDVISTSVGDTVEKGQLIGKSGNTGYSTGPHLHFEVRYNDVPCDPSEYIYFE